MVASLRRSDRPDGEAVADEGSIPVKIVGGRLVAAVELATIHRRIPVNLFIDFETSCGLRLHDSAAASLKTEDEFGGTTPVTMHFPDFAIEVARREQGPQDEYAAFTRLHSEELSDGKVRALAISTTSYDSIIDAEWCQHLGFPAGDVSPLNLGELDLAEFVAFRPAEMPHKHPDGEVGLMGLNLLKHLQLTIDRKNKTALCRVSAPPEFPVADRYPNSAHQLHAAMGEILLDHDEDKRALSRYVQAVIKVETGEQALKGIDRVQRKMGDRKAMSVDTIAP